MIIELTGSIEDDPVLAIGAATLKWQLRSSRAVTTSILAFFSDYADIFIFARQPRSSNLIESQKTNLSENFLPLDLSISLTLP